MYSVTARIDSIKQPRGGYIKPSEFDVEYFNDGIKLYDSENVHGSIIGMTVDYLSRFIIGTNKNEAFRIPILGSIRAEELGVNNSINIAKTYLDNIKGLDKNSIINSCKLVTFDVWRRNPHGAMLAKTHLETNPDNDTIENIITLVKRSILFFNKYGPIVRDGFTFEPVNANIKDYETMIKTGNGSFGGYTATVSSGDGDFLTTDTIWDFKVTKTKITSKHTLQLLMYWIMGNHSGQNVFKNIKRIGIFNPRFNVIYTLDISKISSEIISTVEKEIICY